MKIITAADMPQGSEAWRAKHIGLPTASEFAKIVTPAKLELAKGRVTLAYRLAAERLLNQSFGAQLDAIGWIDHGKQYESLAVGQYQTLMDLETIPVGMILTDDEKLGCSPDRLVSTDKKHGLEIKSPAPPTMIRYFMEGTGADHRVQVFGQMYVGELDVNDFFAANPYMPPYFKRWIRKEVAKEIDTVGSHVRQFSDELEKIIEHMNATGFFSRSNAALTPLGKLIADLEQEIMLLNTVGAIERWESDLHTLGQLARLPRDEAEKLLGQAGEKRAILALGAP